MKAGVYWVNGSAQHTSHTHHIQSYILFDKGLWELVTVIQTQKNLPFSNKVGEKSRETVILTKYSDKDRILPSYKFLGVNRWPATKTTSDPPQLLENMPPTISRKTRKILPFPFAVWLGGGSLEVRVKRDSFLLMPKKCKFTRLHRKTESSEVMEIGKCYLEASCYINQGVMIAPTFFSFEKCKSDIIIGSIIALNSSLRWHS